MSHLTGILNKNKQLVAAVMDGTAKTSVVNEKTESWTPSSPNYSALMTKQDNLTDFVNDFLTDYEGKIAEIEALA